MKTIDQIVVGVDYSPCSTRALQEAVRLSRHGRHPLICLHVLDSRILEDLGEEVAMDVDVVVSDSLRRLRAFVAEQAAVPDGSVDCRVAIGHPFEQLLKAVDEASAGLLVLGVRGHKQKDKTRTGTFATLCVRRAPVEVLLVRESHQDAFRNVAACIDFSKTSQQALQRAAGIVRHEGGQLRVIHVWEPPMIDPMSDFGGLGTLLPVIDPQEMIPVLEKRLAEFVREALAGDSLAESAEQVVLQALDVSHAVSHYINENAVDLVVLGTQGRTGLRRLLMGTTAEKLIHDAPCSVWTLKPEGFAYEA